MDFDFKDLELIALRDVWFARQGRSGVSKDFHIRRIFREYSQKFFTPLHEVYELPIEFVVQAWLEDLYEDWKDEELLKEAQGLTRSIEDFMAARRREDVADADMYEFQKDIDRSEQAAKKLEDAVRNLGGAVDAFRRARPMTEEERLTGARLSKPVEMTNVKVVPGQEIRIKFEEFDLEADSFGLRDDAKKQPKP